MYYNTIEHTMTVKDALLKQKQELDIRKEEHYIERTADLRDGNNRLIRIVIDT